YGYKQDGVKYDENGNSLATLLDRVTPASNNQIIEENPKVIDLQESDPWGFMITITCMLVVFVGLILLYLFFKIIGNVSHNVTQKRVAESGKLSAVRSESQLSGDVLAAISAAIAEMQEDQHDIESTILTIQQVRRNYSPWSSKIYSLRQHPHK
nr:OadG family protein [Dysgonamonadaceae bacterium]